MYWFLQIERFVRIVKRYDGVNNYGCVFEEYDAVGTALKLGRSQACLCLCGKMKRSPLFFWISVVSFLENTKILYYNLLFYILNGL